eukprot:NODE_3_length_4746_cov_337.144745.p2 GENE.NODE_3_length_4746_cov_337.144745~~NODE_3_length_4746_cov_337.144745.p2  ORF type:complete len:719 (-),score=184.67 NODE_3_length_4746_cov_337.144745:156-2312(-)
MASEPVRAAMMGGATIDAAMVASAAPSAGALSLGTSAALLSPLLGGVANPASLVPPAATLLRLMLVTVIVSVVPSVATALFFRVLSRRATPGGMLARLTMSHSRLIWTGVILLGPTDSTFVLPYFCGKFIVLIGAPGGIDHAALKRIIQLLLLTAVLACLSIAIRGFCYRLANERILCRLRKDVFAALLKQEVAYFDNETSGALIARITSDTAVVQNAASIGIANGLRGLANILLSAGVLLIISWRITVVLFVLVPVMSVPTLLFSRLARRIAEKYQQATADAGFVVGETIGNIRTVHSFRAGEKLMEERYGDALDRVLSAGWFRSMMFGGWSGVFGVMYYVAFVFVLWVGAALVDRGEMGVDGLTAYILYMLNLVFYLTLVAGLVPEFGSAIGSTIKLSALMNRVPAMRSGTEDPGEACSGEVQFDHVSFAYPSRNEVVVLSDVSFAANQGQVVALVGASGSGKSSCISLVLRHYDTTAGIVTLHGRNVRDFKTEYLRRHIVVVAQEPALFATSVRKNIGFGREGATEDEIVAVAKLAHCHDFINGFPQGYDTQVGERGAQLSGGQKQRIAIARALLMNPSVLLLDEATSALDAASEEVVQNALNRLLEQRTDRTSIVVAHRLSTIRDANIIVVLAGGRVQEKGTHNELLEHRSSYWDLVERQLQERRASDTPANADTGAARGETGGGDGGGGYSNHAGEAGGRNANFEAMQIEAAR